MTTFKKNDRVYVNPDVSTKYAGRVWTVVELPKGRNGVNYKVQDESGMVLRARADYLIPESEGAAASFPTRTLEVFTRGEFVKLRGRDNIFMVYNQGPKNVTIIEAGGGLEMYARPAALTRLATADVLK